MKTLLLYVVGIMTMGGCVADVGDTVPQEDVSEARAAWKLAVLCKAKGLPCMWECNAEGMACLPAAPHPHGTVSGLGPLAGCLRALVAPGCAYDYTNGERCLIVAGVGYCDIPKPQ
jgi:hypothetical protein